MEQKFEVASREATTRNGEGAIKPRDESKDKVPVYTTPYGTRYVLPIDLLFTREEIDRFADEALAERSKAANRE